MNLCWREPRGGWNAISGIPTTTFSRVKFLDHKLRNGSLVQSFSKLEQSGFLGAINKLQGQYTTSIRPCLINLPYIYIFACKWIVGELALNWADRLLNRINCPILALERRYEWVACSKDTQPKVASQAELDWYCTSRFSFVENRRIIHR